MRLIAATFRDLYDIEALHPDSFFFDGIRRINIAFMICIESKRVFTGSSRRRTLSQMARYRQDTNARLLPQSTAFVSHGPYEGSLEEIMIYVKLLHDLHQITLFRYFHRICIFPGRKIPLRLSPL